MSLDLFLKRYDHSCRNQRRENDPNTTGGGEHYDFLWDTCAVWGKAAPFPSRSVDAAPHNLGQSQLRWSLLRRRIIRLARMIC